MKHVKPVSATEITTAAARRGTTSRRITETPITSMASVSSRMVREPRSALIAEPTAAAIRIAATRGAPCRITASPLAAPASAVAPSCPASRLNCTARVMLIGTAMNSVGTTAVRAMNTACSTNSQNGNRPRTMSPIRCWNTRTASTH
ncbi:hypothetical protein MCHIJ_00160 [Mycolicibacterium chitae]|nr:hypothetical protein MCHIJ_00160 [Mycolicibacterium chitae]